MCIMIFYTSRFCFCFIYSLYTQDFLFLLLQYFFACTTKNAKRSGKIFILFLHVLYMMIGHINAICWVRLHVACTLNYSLVFLFHCFSNSKYFWLFSFWFTSNFLQILNKKSHKTEWRNAQFTLTIETRMNLFRSQLKF